MDSLDEFESRAFAETVAAHSNPSPHGPFPLSFNEVEAVFAPILSLNLSQASQSAVDGSPGVASVLLNAIATRIDICAESPHALDADTLPAFRQELSELRKAISDVRGRVPIIEQRKAELLGTLTELQHQAESLEQQPAALTNPVTFDSGKLPISLLLTAS
ncbi:hypothetical protein BDY19DRAFT_996914 [Irpex rosettiformis]|uniref:Uncharacterized protein n=1 Tax=Irpex rosettiformis TaxID=378272 RepID=A0ACB8TTA8_9APHY|nr:hypothetical protein BDY19DRAFT_996914 [Irpex rosettiformis]